MTSLFNPASKWRLPGPVLVVLVLGLTACTSRLKEAVAPGSPSRSVMEFMALTGNKSAEFDRAFLRSFANRNGIETQYVPGLDDMNSRLSIYQQLFRSHSGKPDLLQIDVIWPVLLADNLIDLRPYLSGDAKSFIPGLLDNYTVRGKIVAIPSEIDMGVLYYRPELLARYGYRNPPVTWTELEQMATRIQAGERRKGNKDFWGYVWQGGAYEGLTCNAVEWQASMGGGTFIEASGFVNVRNPRFVSALRMATRWIGTISPPGEAVYQEDDAINLWNAGQSAFMRNWTSLYSGVTKTPGKDTQPLAVAPLPGGPGGQRGTLGGLALSVSKYATNRDAAIRALMDLTSEANDLNRARIVEGLTTHVRMQEQKRTTTQNLVLAQSQVLVHGLTPRPSLIAGGKYDQVSREYSLAVNAVLRRKIAPEQAMAALENKLVEITGLPAVNPGPGTSLMAGRR